MSITVDIEKLLSELDKVQLTPKRNFPMMGEGSLFYVAEDFSVCLVANPWRSDTRLNEVIGMLDAELEEARNNRVLCGLTGLLVACVLKKGDSLKYYNLKEWRDTLFAAYLEYRCFHDFPTEELMLHEVDFDYFKSDFSEILTPTIILRIEKIKEAFYYFCMNREMKRNGFLAADDTADWQNLLWLSSPSWNEICVVDNKKVNYIKPDVDFIPTIEFGVLNKSSLKCNGLIASLANLNYYYVLLERRFSVKDFNLCHWDRIDSMYRESEDDSDTDSVVNVFSDAVTTDEFDGDFGMDTDALFECYLSTLKNRVCETLKSQPTRVSRSKLNDACLIEQIFRWEKQWLDEAVNSNLRTAFPHATWERYVNYAKGFLEYLCEIHHVDPTNEVKMVVETPPAQVVEEKKMELPSPTDTSILSDEQKLRLAFKRAIKDLHCQVYSGCTFYINTAQDWVIVEKFALDFGLINNKNKHKLLFDLLDEIEDEYRIKLNNKPNTGANLSQKKDVILRSSSYPNWVQGKCDMMDFKRFSDFGKSLHERFVVHCIELNIKPPSL